MSGQPIRTDKTCLNCRSVVEKKYCPECGQKNTESRQSFVHLFTHFFEDFTHYDNAFWKTMRHLLFRPALLTKEYLAGRRQKYVPPVRLYIFISFVTFLIIGMETASMMKSELPEEAESSVNLKFNRKDSISKNFKVGDYKSLRELDSIENTKPVSERMGFIESKMERKFAVLTEKYKGKSSQFTRDVMESIVNSLPKVLFLYLPIFAFALWLFHGKKRWYYFEHGIFTLHYFSFLLLTFTMSQIVIRSLNFVMGEDLDSGFIVLLLIPWWVFYFFRSHRRMYGESKLISRAKGIALFFINFFLISVALTGAVYYALLTL